MLLIYALYRRDPVFIAGQALGLVVYFRNLYFIIVNGRQSSAQEIERCLEPSLSLASSAGRRAKNELATGCRVI